MGWDLKLVNAGGETVRWRSLGLGGGDVVILATGEHPVCLAFDTGDRKDAPRMRLHALACALSGRSDGAAPKVFSAACEMRDAMKLDPTLTLEVS